MNPSAPRSAPHPFEGAPHRTLLALSLPVLGSLVAEPLTGLVDTAFVARLGAEGLAALGVGTIALSGVFWIFNFLGVGTQTEVAQALGRDERERAVRVNGMAMLLGVVFGTALLVAGWPAIPAAARLLGASGGVEAAAVAYMRIRLFGAPAVLATLTAFGALRGMQEMRAPLWIAVAVNALNIVLDALLIFGPGPFPELGIAGAAWASVAAQWLGAAWATASVGRRLGVPARLVLGDAARLLHVGGDLFVRTGLLTLFLMWTTREATRIGAEAGAAHQAIRQVWTFTALVLDAFAITGQSLVGYFVGSGRMEAARRVARVVCAWSLWSGAALGVLMLLGEEAVARLLVPASAVGVFGPAWRAAAVVQPVNALSFATDGLHWGTGDYRYLRNAMLAATAVGGAGLWLVDPAAPGALTGVWVVMGAWIAVRAALGVVRIWPGVGRSPWRDGAGSVRF